MLYIYFVLFNSFFWDFSVYFQEIWQVFISPRDANDKQRCHHSRSAEVPTIRCRVNTGDGVGPFWLMCSRGAGGKAAAYLPEQPELRHTSLCTHFTNQQPHAEKMTVTA